LRARGNREKPADEKRLAYGCSRNSVFMHIPSPALVGFNFGEPVAATPPPLIATGRERHRADDQNLHEVEDAGRATSSPGQDPRGHLRERTEPHQGDYRCHPRLGRFKIILENQGTAEALTMSTSGHIILLFSGLSVAAYVIWSGTGKDVTGRPDQDQRQYQVSNPASSGKSVFSRSGEPSSSSVEPTVVTILERPVKGSVAPSPLPRGRDAIGRELQKELKRVGCYAGELNGEWTASTRHAMSAFAERVNARLPTVQPDSILLALVQGYPTKVCGIPCPPGQSLSRTQECTPDALLARSNGTKLTADRGQELTKEAGRWTVKTTVTGVPVPATDTDPSGYVPPVALPSSSANPPLHAPHRVARGHWRPPVRRDRGWASNFFSLF
jgi:hypothetical protein